MPRRRSIKIVCLTAAVFACGGIAYFAVHRQPEEPSFLGRSASYWLRQVVGRRTSAPALEAFGQMGTNAEPVLVAAIAGRENSFAGIFRRVYPRLPPVIQNRFSPPENLRQLRAAAGLVVQSTPLDGIAPKLLPLLAKPDSELRLIVLNLVANRIGPSDAGQVPFLLLAVKDPDPGVRIDAAWALWKITAQTDYALRVLKDLLRQGDDYHCVKWADAYLLDVGRPDPSFISILTNSLASVRKAERATACGYLGQLGPQAAAAIPSLRAALRDPSEDVRHRAQFALKRIDPQPK
jgi:HEAT repeat protein